MLGKIVVIIAAYFMGAFPSGYVIGKCFCNINIMEHGSKNVGSTNTLRVLGPKVAAVVFALDLGKGFLAAFLGNLVGGPTFSVITGALAIFAHTFSVFIHFKGGKGVATGAGAMFFWCPPAILCALAIWTILAYITGYVSVASIVACISCVLFLIPFHGTLPKIIFSALIVCYIIWKHRSNISRLLKGTENRIDWKAKFKKQ